MQRSLDSTGRPVDLEASLKEAADITVSPRYLLLQFNEGNIKYHNNLNMAKAQAIKLLVDQPITRGPSTHPTAVNQVKIRVTRRQAQMEKEEQLEEQAREKKYLENEKREQEQKYKDFTSTDTDEVTHPHFKDTQITKTLAHRKIRESQQ